MLEWLAGAGVIELPNGRIKIFSPPVLRGPTSNNLAQNGLAFEPEQSVAVVTGTAATGLRILPCRL
jgi:hypothetical protein